MMGVLSSPVDAVSPLLRVAVVAEDPLARAGLGALVAEPHRVEVVAQGGGITDVLSPVGEGVDKLMVDVLVVDGATSATAVAPSSIVGVVALVRDESEARSALEHG